MADTRKIMIVAGEASGDAHAAKLVRAIREAAPHVNFEFFGAAGPMMREAGVEPIVRSDDLGIIGLLEIVASASKFLRAFRQLKREAGVRDPDAAILVDFPEFNLRLAKALKGQGVTTVYYISPQMWAWRQGRVRLVQQFVDLMLTILPFEKEWYARHGVENVEYVGNPLAREVHPEKDKTTFCRDHNLDVDKPIIALLPGSRAKEISRILPMMLETAKLISQGRPEVQFIVALPTEQHRAASGPLDWDALPDSVRVITKETYNALSVADAAAITSGTATLEAGIIGTPMAVVYKTSALNHAIFEPMIDVEYFGLINLIAGKAVAKEFVGRDFTTDVLAAELLRLLQPETNNTVRSELRAAADKLGRSGASGRAADAILTLLDRKSA